ncbi:MAG: hypothetical protein NZL93_04840 [Chthoniobacterales bacterium]|nr:hypothetical protein [Chthoniobacterales bacterium]
MYWVEWQGAPMGANTATLTIEARTQDAQEHPIIIGSDGIT